MFRKMTIKFKKALVSLMCVSLLIPNVPVMAADTTDVNFNVKATEVNITVPMNFSVTINPNLPYDNGGFVYADNITVTNDTTCPITLGISNFADEEQTFEEDVLPSDVANWDDLSVKGTKKYFALGMLAKDSTEWMNYNLDSALYAKTIQESSESISFGEIETKASVNFDLEASYGKAVKEGFTFTYQITWVSELYDGGSDSGSGNSGSTTTPTTYSVDEDATSNLNYETTTNQVAQANLLDELLGTETVMAAPVDKEIDSSKIVGTALISGVKDTSVSDIYVADYYEDANGNLYEIVGVKENTNLSDCENVTSITTNNSSIADALGNELTYDNVQNTNVTVNGQDYVLNIEVKADEIEDKITVYEEGTRHIDDAEYQFEVVDIENSYPAYNGKACAGYAMINTVNTLEEPTNIVFPTYFVSNGNYYYVTGISDYALTYNDYVESIYIPSSFETIGDEAINSNSSLANYYVSKNNTAFCSLDGVLYTKDLSVLLSYPTVKDYESLLIPSNVETIGPSAFAGNNTLASVKIPGSVKTISKRAFNQCRGLTSLSLSEGLETIGDYAFVYAGIKTLSIPSTVISIGANAFEGCQSLVDINFVDGSQLKSIGNSAFAQCISLEEVVLPNGLETIGNSTFNMYAMNADTNKLTSVTIPASVTSIGSWAFDYCNQLTTINYSGPATGAPWGAPNATVVAN